MSGQALPVAVFCLATGAALGCLFLLFQGMSQLLGLKKLGAALVDVLFCCLCGGFVFLCALAGLSLRDRQDRVPGVVIETEAEVPREEIAPDFPPVDLNTATAEELDTLPGIGESLARRIIAYREANGPFGSIEEIMEVSGIGEAKFAELEDRVTVDNGKGEVTNEDSGG